MDFDDLERKEAEVGDLCEGTIGPYPTAEPPWVEMEPKVNGSSQSKVSKRQTKGPGRPTLEFGNEKPVKAPSIPLSVRLRRRWWITSEAFVDMLGHMRNSFIGGKEFMEAMWNLMLDPPKGQKPFTGGDSLTFDHFAAALLYDTQDALQPKPGLPVKEVENLTKLLQRLEGFVNSETNTLQQQWDWTLNPQSFGPECWRAAQQAQVAFPGKIPANTSLPMGGFNGQRHLLFVGLPLALYCSDCPHLYQVLHRMRAVANVDDAPATAKSLRKKLDYDGRPYSVLIYALMGALQALSSLRYCGTGLEPLAPKGGVLIFRGLWVPEVIEEHWAEHSWAFNSFSRSIDGVLSVLGFYANATGSAAEALATKDAHILLLVARGNHGEANGARWAFPVQLYAGGENAFPASIEQEVLVPPFCKYHFERDLEVSSLDEAEEQRRRLQLLESRWSLSLQQEAPRLLQLFESDAFAHQKGFMFVKERVRLTIRFIKEIEPVLHLRDLLRAPSSGCSSMQRYRLLHFPLR